MNKRTKELRKRQRRQMFKAKKLRREKTDDLHEWAVMALMAQHEGAMTEGQARRIMRIDYATRDAMMQRARTAMDYLKI